MILYAGAFGVNLAILILVVFSRDSEIRLGLIGLFCGVLLLNLRKIDDLEVIPSSILVNFVSIPILIWTTLIVTLLAKILLSRAQTLQNLRRESTYRKRK
jgi:hypothetical protein